MAAGTGSDRIDGPRNFMVFRSVASPNWEGGPDGAPARFDPVTCVQAPDPETAIKAVIGTVGLIGSFCACEAYLFEVTPGHQRIARGGRLIVETAPELDAGSAGD